MPTLVTTAVPLLAAGADHSFVSIALSILGIGFLIFVHELGHFLACRLTRTRVETFAIGFGPRLFGWETDPTGRRRFTVGARRLEASTGAMDVRIAAIPLGGYVKMAGEIGGDGTPSSGSDAEPRPPRPDEFPSKTVGQRMLIACAGVVMNVVAAFGLYWVAYAAGLLDAPAVVGDAAPGGPAWRAGLRPGDRVLAVDGEVVRSFTDLQMEMVHGGDATAALEIERAGARRALSVHPEYDEAAGLRRAQIYPSASWRVDDGAHPPFTIGAADAARVEGRPVVGGRAAAQAAMEAADLGYEEVRVEVAGGAPRTVDLRPLRRWSEKGPFRIGIVPANRFVVRYVRPGGPAEAKGLRPDDEVLAADGAALDHPGRLAFLPAIRELRVRRGGAEVVVPAGATTPDEVAAFVADVAFWREAAPGPVLVAPDGLEFEDGKSPAAEAGVRAGDRLLSIAGAEVSSWADVIAAAASLSSAPVRLRVQTGAETPREVMAMPRAVRDLAPRERFFAVEGEMVPIPAGGVLPAAGLAAGRTVAEVRNVFRVIGGFFGGAISFQKNVGGPFTIATVTSATVTQHWTRFLAFLAFISVNLAVLNILPVPVLDGGTMLFLLIEKARRGRPLSPATVGRLQMVGFILLMALMVFALKNDFVNLFGR